MKISKNKEMDNEKHPPLHVDVPDIPLGVAGMNDSSSGVHSPDEVYLQIKSLLNIPPDEPIFILRAQDKFAADLIAAYRKRVRDGSHPGGKRVNRSDNFFAWWENIGSIINDFVNWKNSHKNNMKVPD